MAQSRSCHCQIRLSCYDMYCRKPLWHTQVIAAVESDIALGSRVSNPHDVVRVTRIDHPGDPFWDRGRFILAIPLEVAGSIILNTHFGIARLILAILLWLCLVIATPFEILRFHDCDTFSERGVTESRHWMRPPQR